MSLIPAQADWRHRAVSSFKETCYNKDPRDFPEQISMPHGLEMPKGLLTRLARREKVSEFRHIAPAGSF